MTYPRPAVSGAAFGPAAVVPSPRFPQIETEVLDYWRADDTFRASIARREGAPEWVFYDGPPFANGLPHYGHLLTGTRKTSSRGSRRCAARRSIASSDGTRTVFPPSSRR